MRTARHIGKLMLAAGLTILFSCTGSDDPTNPSGDGDSIPPIEIGDTVPPQAVSGLQINYNRPSNRLLIEWIAPWDNDVDERVDRYEIRYAYTRGYEPPNFWTQSMIVFDPPPPGDPGSTEHYIVSNARYGEDFYIGVRAYDADNNVSPDGNLVMMHVPGLTFSGQVINGLTGVPVPGLDVRMTAGVVHDLVTDTDGRFVHEDLVPGAASIRIRGESSGVSFHQLTQVLVLGGDASATFTMIPYLPTVMPESQGMSALALQKTLSGTDGANSLLAKWKTVPVPVYIPQYVYADSVDYEQQTVLAMQRWNDRIGRTFFERVASPPVSGVFVRYKTKAEMGVLVAVTRPTTATDGHPIRDDIDITNDLVTSDLVYRVMLHEFGHTLRFGHMTNRAYIMFGGQPLPGDISDDEVLAARIHLGLPIRVDMSIYDESSPLP